ncbi:MAG: 3-dehydroquinate synthase [Kiritimatiellaeota bacterium]|nr:3-dehydroquinate synthase [Kiritimatiellota bacterium]
MKKIQVGLSDHPYDIFVRANLVDDLPAKVEKFVAERKVLIVTDSNVNKLYGKKVEKLLCQATPQVSIVEFPAGEPSKTLATLENLYNECVSLELDRSSVVVALGGGVVGDLAGFLAATYMRGVEYIQIPTSLLAMVDSSVGGKTGVDLPAGKNLIGAFWQPKIVIIDPMFLQTLPKREIKCGLAEVVKYGMIMDERFFAFLEESVDALNAMDLDCFTAIIARCCELKVDVVLKDEREESGLRAILNYGHTFAHAIEASMGFGKINHGEAVAVGMCMAANLAVDDARLDDAAELRQETLLRDLALPCSVEGVSPSDIHSAMRHDKKVVDGRVRFVLPDTIGAVTLSNGPMEKSKIMEAIRNCCD